MYQEPQAYILPRASALDKVALEGDKYPHSAEMRLVRFLFFSKLVLGSDVYSVAFFVFAKCRIIYFCGEYNTI